MDIIKNSEQNLNNENIKNQQNKFYESQNEKEIIEIIIELEISDEELDREINILCDKNQLFEKIKNNEDYNENNVIPPKEFHYFNKNNTKLYLNDNEIEFNYKIKFDKIGINKIKIKSNINLICLSSMFFYCSNIININFVKFDINNVNDMSYMFSYCKSLTEVNLSSINTKNVTNMSNMFNNCYNLNELDLSSFDTKNVTNMSFMFSEC